MQHHVFAQRQGAFQYSRLELPLKKGNKVVNVLAPHELFAIIMRSTEDRRMLSMLGPVLSVSLQHLLRHNGSRHTPAAWVSRGEHGNSGPALFWAAVKGEEWARRLGV